MRAIQIRGIGGPEVLELVDAPEPQPGPGQIRIRHQACGLNFIDTYQRGGLYPIPLPSILGCEGAGVVDAVGDGVSRFSVGDRAAYASGLGGYAEANVIHERGAVRLPETIGADVAAASLLKGMTVEALLRRCYPLAAGEPVLIHAAAGGVGQIMVQWARAIGAEVIATVGSEAKAQRVRDLGAAHVILYGQQDVAAEVRRITGGRGVPVAYDSVGAATFEGTLASLARRGMFVSFGNASGPAPPVPPLRLSRGGSLYLTRPTLYDYVAEPGELDGSATALFEMIASGQVKIEIGQTFPLEQARAAHEALAARTTVGSTLLIP